MLTACLISLALFVAVTAFCKHEGMFDAGSMGIGQFIAVLLYAFGWLLPTLAMLVGVWVG